MSMLLDLLEKETVPFAITATHPRFGPQPLALVRVHQIPAPSNGKNCPALGRLLLVCD